MKLKSESEGRLVLSNCLWPHGLYSPVFLGFPCGSAGKESTCHVGELSYEPAITLLGDIWKKKNENTNLKMYMHPTFIIALFVTAKVMEAT